MLFAGLNLHFYKYDFSNHGYHHDLDPVSVLAGSATTAEQARSHLKVANILIIITIVIGVIIWLSPLYN